MAETTLSIPNAAYSEAFKNIYGSLPGQTITPQTISLDPKTRESITAEVSAALRPYYDAAAQERQATALQNRAELDADAYSRGMGSSTWLSDKKSRESQAAASDVAGIYSQYGAALSEGVSSQMQTYEANRLTVEQQNAANRMSADAQNAANEMEKYKLAYEILLDQINSGAFRTGGGDGGGDNKKPDPIVITPITKDIVLDIAGVSAPTFGQKAYLR